MKTLNKIDNMDKRTLLSKLLHQELQNIQNTIENQCNYFLKNEIISRKGWNQKGFFAIEFWCSLIENILKTIEKKSPIMKASKLVYQPFFLTDTMHCLLYTTLSNMQITLNK